MLVKATSDQPVYLGIRLFLTPPQNSIWRLTRSASNLLVEMIWNSPSRAVLVIKPLTLLLQPYRIQTYRMYFFPVE